MIRNKNMLGSTIISLLVILVLINTVTATGGSFTETTKYKKFDRNDGVHILTIDIKIPDKGNVEYMENYYSIDSHGELKFYSSSKFFSGEVNQSVLIHIERPRHHYGSSYKFVEKIYNINGIRTKVLIDFSKYW